MSSLRYRTFGCIPLLMLCCSTAKAAEIPGIEVGAKAPSFKVTLNDGKEATLESMLKTGEVALVFYRSADW